MDLEEIFNLIEDLKSDYDLDLEVENEINFILVELDNYID